MALATTLLTLAAGLALYTNFPIPHDQSQRSADSPHAPGYISPGDHPPSPSSNPPSPGSNPPAHIGIPRAKETEERSQRPSRDHLTNPDPARKEDLTLQQAKSAKAAIQEKTNAEQEYPAQHDKWTVHHAERGVTFGAPDWTAAVGPSRLQLTHPPVVHRDHRMIPEELPPPRKVPTVLDEGERMRLDANVKNEQNRTSKSSKATEELRKKNEKGNAITHVEESIGQHESKNLLHLYPIDGSHYMVTADAPKVKHAVAEKLPIMFESGVVQFRIPNFMGSFVKSPDYEKEHGNDFMKSLSHGKDLLSVIHPDEQMEDTEFQDALTSLLRTIEWVIVDPYTKKKHTSPVWILKPWNGLNENGMDWILDAQTQTEPTEFELPILMVYQKPKEEPSKKPQQVLKAKMFSRKRTYDQAEKLTYLGTHPGIEGNVGTHPGIERDVVFLHPDALEVPGLMPCSMVDFYLKLQTSERKFYRNLEHGEDRNNQKLQIGQIFRMDKLNNALPETKMMKEQ